MLEGDVERELGGEGEEFGAKSFFLFWLTFEGPRENGIEGLGGGREALGELIGVCDLKAVRDEDGADAVLMEVREGGAENGEDEWMIFTLGGRGCHADSTIRGDVERED